MNLKTTLHILTLLVSLVFAAGASADELSDGLQAYENGDYAEAIEILTPLAEYHGYTKAMNMLGLMAEQGMGIPPDGTAAEKWYKKAARLRDEDAMYNLGVLHGEGKVVPKDYVKAVAWLGAAYDHRQGDALKVAKLVSSQMSEEELKEAGKLREEINQLLYAVDSDDTANVLQAPPIPPEKLLNNEQILDTYSGKTVTFMFRDSEVRETYKDHSSRKKALAGKKARFKGEYRQGFYNGKWWVENNMMCFDYDRLEFFDDCIWIEKISDKENRTYSRKTGEQNTDRLK